MNTPERNWETDTGKFLNVLQRPLGDTRSSNLAKNKQRKKRIAARPLVPPGHYG